MLVTSTQPNYCFFFNRIKYLIDMGLRQVTKKNLKIKRHRNCMHIDFEFDTPHKIVGTIVIHEFF